MTGVGRVEITATQAGNANYAMAMQTQTITVSATLLTVQTIVFTSSSTGIVGSDITLEAKATSGLDVTFEITAETLPNGLAATVGRVATLNIDTLTLVGPGMVTITATQSGNADYAMATQTQDITVMASNIRRVTTTGNAEANGSSWANAMTLQAALAASTMAEDQVWIAEGTYTPHVDDRTATFRISAGVLIYGGFNGTEAALADRAGTATILSGDLMGDDGTRPVRPLAGEDTTAYNAARSAYDATRNDNSNVVVTITGSNVTLDRLTITAGEGGSDAARGAGLYAGSRASGLTLKACTFTGNEAESSGGGAHFSGTATLTNCTFNNNGADVGGGAYLQWNRYAHQLYLHRQ